MVDRIGLGPCETGFTHRTSSPQQSCKALRSFMAQQSTDLAEEKNMKLSPLLFVGMNLNKKWNQNPPLGLLCWSFPVFLLPRCLSFLSKSIDVFSDVLCFFQTFLGVPLSQITSSSFQNIPTGAHGSWDYTNASWPKWFLGSLGVHDTKISRYNLATATVTSQNQVGQVGAWSFFGGKKTSATFLKQKHQARPAPHVLCCAMVPPSGASGASSCDTTWLLAGK